MPECTPLRKLRWCFATSWFGFSRSTSTSLSGFIIGCARNAVTTCTLWNALSPLQVGQCISKRTIPATNQHVVSQLWDWLSRRLDDMWTVQFACCVFSKSYSESLSNPDLPSNFFANWPQILLSACWLTMSWFVGKSFSKHAVLCTPVAPRKDGAAASNEASEWV